LAVIYLAGCNQVFGLAETKPYPMPAFVQVHATETTMQTTCTAAFDQPLVAGDAVVVSIYIEDTTITTVTDSLGSQYTRLVGPIADTLNDAVYIFAAFDVAGGADTVTATAAASALTLTLYVHEYSNIAAFDAGNGASGVDDNIDAMKSGPIATRTANELLFGFGIADSTAAGTGFTARSSYRNNVSEDRITDAAGSYQATGTATGTPPDNAPIYIIAGAAFTSMR
jgi:hypothetical protein